MKFNKWTVGLAAIGVVSLASAARADEKMSPVQSALSNTTISGYVSASFNWAMSPGGQQQQNSPAAGIPYQRGYGNTDSNLSKQDGFNLDVIKLSIAKPQDESPWAAGYQLDLLFGPDAVGYNNSANATTTVDGRGRRTYSGSTMTDFAIKQAYVVLRTPVGNGIDWKVGVFDSPLGYESFDAGNDPNYTRSWGNAIEPTELTGVLASYKVCDEFSLSAGVANTLMAGINARAYNYAYDNGPELNRAWHKAFIGSATFTGPSSWGWAAGSSLYAGIVYGFNDAGGGANNGYHQGGDQINYYAGATLNTPCKQLTVGMAFDYAHNLGGGGSWTAGGGFPHSSWNGNYEDNVLVAGLYATFKATDKLSISARGEYVYGEEASTGGGYVQTGYNNQDQPIYGGRSYNRTQSADGFELTGTVEYDLWANVISRLELRWDHINSLKNIDDVGFGGSGDDSITHRNSVGFYANVIYKF